MTTQRSTIVAMLRARMTSEQITADRNRPEYGERSLLVATYERAASVLREMADAVEALPEPESDDPTVLNAEQTAQLDAILASPQKAPQWLRKALAGRLTTRSR